METRFRESVRRPWRAPVGEGARRLVGRATCEVGSAGAGPSRRPGDARAAGFSFKWALNWQKMPDYDIRGFPWGGRMPFNSHSHVSMVGKRAGQEGAPFSPTRRAPARSPPAAPRDRTIWHFLPFSGRRQKNRREHPRAARPGGRDRARLRHPGQKRGMGRKP